jgi:tRNA (guanine10-N2)-methyltransferase
MSHLGATCFGTDIDMRVLSGIMYAGASRHPADTDKKHTIWENFKHYGLPAPEIIRVDNHMFRGHYSPSLSNLFDAIVTDPPYGIRAGAKKTGRREDRGPLDIPVELRESHVPGTQQYAVEEVMLDLLDLASVSLKVYV